MSYRKFAAACAFATGLGLGAAPAHATYWNLFNIEGEKAITADFVTYATLDDMMHDTNRLSVVSANGAGSFDRNIVGTGSDGKVYWNLFNIEGENAITADFVTYATLSDMMHDVNRLGVVSAFGGGSFDHNIVGTGSDGKVYWNVFNIEGENAITADFVTYATLDDMMHDTNRLGVVSATGGGSFDRNIVESGSNGIVYWNLFNIEGESAITADFVTYATLDDMMHDTNRLSVVSATGGGSFDRNIVGTGSDELAIPPPVPEPGSWAMMVAGIGFVGAGLRRSIARRLKFA